MEVFRLYDKNNLKINIDYLITNALIQRIDLKLLLTQEAVVLSAEDSEKLLDEFNNSTSILKISYQIISEEEEPAEEKVTEPSTNNKIEVDKDSQSNIINFNKIGRPFGGGGYRNFLSKQKQKKIIPITWSPENINLDDYNLDIYNDKLVTVTSKETIYRIDFEPTLVVEDNAKNDTPAKLSVYTQIVNSSTINLVHCHILDTSIDNDTVISNCCILAKNQNAKQLQSSGLVSKNFPDKSNIQLYYKDFKVKFVK